MSERDYGSISPSAKAILLVRSQTALPYAREAAAILYGEGAIAKTARDVAEHADAAKRVVHFEQRARSVDAALAASGVKQVLEIGGGLSFRGLSRVEREDVAYVDSDLRDMVAIKRDLVPRLSSLPRRGDLRLEELDALDGAAFARLVATLRPGPVAIVNEGLLMYLDDDEKRRLAANVRAALLARGAGSVWITADVYVRLGETLFRDARAQAFADKHGIDDKKFADLAAAEAFFGSNGFAISARDGGSPIRETWTLRAVE